MSAALLAPLVDQLRATLDAHVSPELPEALRLELRRQAWLVGLVADHYAHGGTPAALVEVLRATIAAIEREASPGNA